MNPIFKQIFDAAGRHGVDCVIAGGAAIDFNRATDIDVFVFGTGSLDLAAALDPDFLQTFERYEDSEFQVVGSCRPFWSRKDIQITRRKDCCTIVGLLQQFDLSVHQWAVDRVDQVWQVSTSTTPDQPIAVIHMDPTTPQRLAKLWQRYADKRTV